MVDRSGAAGSAPTTRTATINPLFQTHYKKPFEGKIYLPRFSVRANGTAEPLDYYRHLLSRVDVGEFGYAGVNWDLRDALAAAKEQFYRITLGGDDPERLGEKAASTPESDEQAAAWVASNLPFDHFSHKQVRAVVRNIVRRLTKTNSDLTGQLAVVKFELRKRIEGFIQYETDEQTKAAFERLFRAGDLCFHLECVECRFEIPLSVELRALKPLLRDDYSQVQRSLFDYVPDDLNEYERSVALYLDAHPQVLWWYRNLVGPENFSIQGFRRNPIYPDFVVQEGRDTKPVARVMVLESKGKHLKGSEDTNYKRAVADYFNQTGREVPWQELAEEFDGHRFRFQILDEGEYADRDWKDELRKLLENGTS